MSLFFPSQEDLRQLSLDHAEAARTLHQLVKDTRLVIEETERLLESPIWARMGSQDPGQR
jgi:hypothetical protein